METKTREVAVVFAVLVSLMFFATLGFAVTTLVKTQDSFADFEKGELKGTSLSSDGKITLGPEIESLFDTKANQVWDIVVMPDGAAFAATGNEGKIFSISKDGKGELFCDLEELEVYALALNKEGVLFAGASPGGKIYKIVGKDKSEVFFETKEDYVWDLIFDEQGNLYAATGSKGKIFKIDRAGKGELLYDSKADNVLSLALGPDKKLYASSQGKGFIFRIEKKDKVFVLYQSNADEIKQITFDSNGNLYAALNSSRSPAGPAFLDFTATAPGILDILKLGGEQEIKPGETPKPEKVVEKPVEKPGRASVIKIEPQGYVQTIWTATEAPLHSLFFDHKQDKLLACAGEKGKIFELKQNDEYSILGMVDEKYILCIAPSADGLALGAGNGGEVYGLSFAKAKEGTFKAPVLDMNTPVRWGNIVLELSVPKDASISFRTHSGNTEEPDDTWSEWSDEFAPKDKIVRVESPVSRFIQWQARFKSSQPDSLPVLDTVRVNYLPQNVPPAIKKVDVSKVAEGKKPSLPTISILQELAVKGKGMDEKAQEKPSDVVGKPEDSNTKKVRISWQVDDPNDDELRSALYFKGEEETTWKEIKDKLKERSYIFDTFSVPDGRYRIKVEVSDELSNPPELAQTVNRISDIFYVDNTPPEISDLRSEEKDENKFLIRAVATDEGTLISSAKYNIDAKDWLPLLPVDELFDSKKEEFSFETEKMEGKEHTLSLVVTDSEGNTSAKKVILTLK